MSVFIVNSPEISYVYFIFLDDFQKLKKVEKSTFCFNYRVNVLSNFSMLTQSFVRNSFRFWGNDLKYYYYIGNIYFRYNNKNHIDLTLLYSVKLASL